MMEFCSPVVIFLVFSAIGLITQLVALIVDYTTNNMLVFVGGLVGTILWFIVLNYLCLIDWTVLAWILVLFPFILFILILLLVDDVINIKLVKVTEPTEPYRTK